MTKGEFRLHQRPMMFRLHPATDISALREAFRRDKVVSIQPFLPEETAASLRDHVQGRADWLFRMKGPPQRTFEYKLRDVEAWSQSRREAMRKLAAPLDPDSFCYSYASILAVDEWGKAREEGTPLSRLGAFLSSDEIIGLVREVTGEEVAFADAFASRYGQGDFLTVHGDRKEGSNRLVAYVLGLTSGWRPDWGGLLLFHEEGGKIRTGLPPGFNVLNLFLVPQDHSVSLVTPFAPAPRLSVTGWFRSPLPAA